MAKVFIVCPGVGRIQRGYESFTRECFEALSKHSSIDITLFKGGGKPDNNEIVLRLLPKEKILATQLAKITQKLGEVFKGHYGYDAYYIEQLTFVVSLLPYVQREKPDVIYFSDQTIGDLLGIWRSFSKQSFKLLFCDGSPLTPNLPRCDYVQQLTPAALQRGLAYGIPTEKQIFIPLGFNLSPTLNRVTSAEKLALKKSLCLPEFRSLILSVGAVNKHHKRMDYVVREVANLPNPRPFLLLLGQQEAETSEVLQLGNEVLGSDGFQIRTVPLEKVSDFYKVADCFVLASLREGFGRVFVEALAAGLPCLAHDYDISQFVLGKEGYFGDFNLEGSLTNLLLKIITEGDSESKRCARHRSAYDRFSWDKLIPAYVHMIHYCIKDF
ncbi:glycosyltransferase family 4 protein [Cyanobacteria bacterium FACHB-63]|nr:glycosyltransferase family 4 protein [Cyanobacteria bacterium FACHB-63]